MKKAFGKKQAFSRYVFAIIVIGLGILLNFKNIGKEFLGFPSVGSWLIYVGFAMLAIVTLSLITYRKKIIDERMEKIGYQSSRITFLLIIIAAFIVMIWDGIKTINIEYSLFMSYLISFIVLIYFISYKILERFN